MFIVTVLTKFGIYQFSMCTTGGIMLSCVVEHLPVGGSVVVSFKSLNLKWNLIQAVCGHFRIQAMSAKQVNEPGARRLPGTATVAPAPLFVCLCVY